MVFSEIMKRFTNIVFPLGRLDDWKQETSGDRKINLEIRLQNLRRSFKKNNDFKNWSKIVGIILFILATISFSYYSDPENGGILFIYGLLIYSMSIFQPTHEIEIEIRDIENELDLLSISETSIEERAEKQFKLHQLDLKKYYDQNLRQSAWIFYVGLICIILGFVIIGITQYFIFSSYTNIEISEKIIIASMGTIGGILSDFVGMIYIKMYSESIKSLTDFHNKLVSTHFLHFGNFLLGKIKDETLREKTFAEIASNLSKQGFSEKR